MDKAIRLHMFTNSNKMEKKTPLYYCTSYFRFQWALLAN